MHIFLAATLLLCTFLRVSCSDESVELKTTIPYYVLQASQKNFSDIIVSKVAFDSALENNEAKVLGFLKKDSGNYCFEVYTVQFTLDHNTDNNPGENNKIFSVDIKLLTFQEGTNKRFYGKTQALQFMAQHTTE